MTEKEILKKCKRVSEAVARAPALSCVEYYFIAWLSRLIDIEPLYAETIIPFARAESIIGDEPFENIKAIDRLQNIAERRGIVRHEKIKGVIREIDDRSLYLVKVKPAFFAGKRIPRREDHYVQAVGIIDRYLYVVNEYPLEFQKITLSDGATITDDWLVYRFMGGNGLKREEFRLKTQKPICRSSEGQRLRDALILYRILLKRLKGLRSTDGALDRYIACIDALFYRIAVAVRKGELQKTELARLRAEIYREEKNYTKRSDT